MRRFVVAFLVVLLAVSFVWAARPTSAPLGKTSKYLPLNHVDQIPEMPANWTAPANAARYTPQYSELDVMGDTLIVGSTWWESQHNGTVGRMIGVEPDGRIWVVWTDLESEGGSRHIKLRIASEVEGVLVAEGDAPAQVDNSNRAGYTSMGFNAEDGLVFPGYHATPTANDPYQSRVANEWLLFPGVFIEATIPDYGTDEHIWPRIAFGENAEGTGYVYSAASMNRDDDPAAAMEITFARLEYDGTPGNETLIVPDEQQLITDIGMNIAADVAVSYDGSRVVIGQTVSRDYEDDPNADASQMNNDLWYWLSEDGGETFDWENPVNLTSFIDPDPSYLPDDTLTADQDTFRLYTDLNMYFDHDNVLHAAFTCPGYFSYEGTITYTSTIYHWDENSGVFTRVADGTFWNNQSPGAWQRQAQRPSMYQDPDTGIMWLVYHQYGVPGDTLDEGYARDQSDDGFTCGEVFVTASPAGPYYGKLWANGVNITDTRNETEEPMAAGDCRSEREPSVSLTNPGDYLNIFYILDTDAGFTAQTEGEYTECPAVIHRVSKTEILGMFDSWLPNYPMHCDSTDHWEDDFGYAWDGEWDDPFSRDFANGAEEKTLNPNEFELNQNYPNPFNPTTQISFSLKNEGNVTLAVYDILGREVAKLVDRKLTAGTHGVTFDATDLASGVYFYRLTSGEFTKSMKMMLVK